MRSPCARSQAPRATRSAHLGLTNARLFFGQTVLTVVLYFSYRTPRPTPRLQYFFLPGEGGGGRGVYGRPKNGLHPRTLPLRSACKQKRCAANLHSLKIVRCQCACASQPPCAAHAERFHSGAACSRRHVRRGPESAHWSVPHLLSHNTMHDVACCSYILAGRLRGGLARSFLCPRCSPLFRSCVLSRTRRLMCMSDLGLLT